jgi:hypothetical protein
MSDAPKQDFYAQSLVDQLNVGRGDNRSLWPNAEAAGALFRAGAVCAQAHRWALQRV